MKIAVGADHAGYELKQLLVEKLKSDGHEVIDFGTHTEDSTDYPDYAESVSRSVVSGSTERGLLVCSSGVGMSIAANKIHGIRAALGHTSDEVMYTRRHNDANVLAIGARYTPEGEAREMVDTFLNTGYEGGRHQRRLDKLKKLEQEG